MSKPGIPRVAKGKRPLYFRDPATDKLMAILLTVVEELSVARDRSDALERLLEEKGVLNRSELDAWKPDAAADAQRAARRADYIARVLRIVTMELQPTDDSGATERFSEVLSSLLSPADESSTTS